MAYDATAALPQWLLNLGRFLSCSSSKAGRYDTIAGLGSFQTLPQRQSAEGVRGVRTAVAAEERQPMIGRHDAGEEQRRCGRRGVVGCCCGCFCLLLAVLAALLALVASSFQAEVYGTQFTFWNYGIPQLQFRLAGLESASGQDKWYAALSSDDTTVGLGPGPNTRTLYSWQKVRDALVDFGRRIDDGTMKRYNELGMQLLSPDMWPETGTITFGLSNSDHAAVRPYLGDALDGSRGAYDADCDGSQCWNQRWLRATFRERFDGVDSVASSDLSWMVAVVLHKVHLNMDVSDAEAKDFAAFQSQFVKVAPFPRNWFWEQLLGGFPREVKADYLEIYKRAIRRKWADDDWDGNPGKLTVLASAMLDSMTFAGGLLTTTVLEYLLALLHMEGEPGASVRPLDLTNENTLHDFVWETLRMYAPVGGVPRWITDDHGRTWKHEIPNVAQALKDPAVFPEPLEYRLGRPGLNHEDHSLSIGFAEFAIVNEDISNPNSHGCPSKQLALSILQAFLHEFIAAGPWDAEDAKITLNGYGTSGFLLRKRRQVI